MIYANFLQPEWLDKYIYSIIAFALGKYLDGVKHNSYTNLV